MKKHTQWTLYQILTFFILIISLLMLYNWFDQGIKPGNYSLPFGILFFLVITWMYTMMLLQQQKHPSFLDHKLWRRMPIIITIVSVLSLIGFIILVTMGPLMDWIDQGKWLIYIIFIYVIMLYYFFVMSLVYMLSDNRNRVIHQTYAWSLGLLLVIIFIL